MKKDIKLILAPAKLSSAYGAKYLTQDAINKARDGSISEERYVTNRCYPCPFCGERRTQHFYENAKMREINSVGKAMLKSNIEYNDFGSSRGLSIEEKPVTKRFSKGEWFVKQYHCLSCGSIYESKPYRKDHFVSLV